MAKSMSRSLLRQLRTGPFAFIAARSRSRKPEGTTPHRPELKNYVSGSVGTLLAWPHFLDALSVYLLLDESYERLKRGEFNELENLRGLGYLLIALRIAQGISQRELARRLDVHESQVSRDERNEYFGITLERTIKMLDALNVRLRTRVEEEPEDRTAIA